MSNKAIVVFTARSAKTIKAEGGSQAWRLKYSSAITCRFIVCVQNRRTDWGDGDAVHGSAFLVGRVSGVERSPERPERWIVRISEYATVDVPDRWKGQRNPVRYSTLEDEGIVLALLNFQPMPDPGDAPPVRSGPDQLAVRPLTIAEAKRGLAAAFGVSVDAVEITIRA